MPNFICCIKECDRPVHAKGMCTIHHGYLRRYGDPLAQRQRVRRPKEMSWIDYFWSFVNIAGPDECWDWTGTTRKGYGYLSPEGGSNQVDAHILSYRIAFGNPTKGTVRHTCDRPVCVNPAHLIDGTQADNVRDMVERGRHHIGEDHSHAVLTEAIVREARERKAAGESVGRIARDMGVHQATLAEAVAGRTWKHIDTPTQTGQAVGEAASSAKLTEAKVREIRTRRAAGEKIVPLAKEYGVAPITISNIIHRKKWKHVE